jgi:hypothetical protein
MYYWKIKSLQFILSSVIVFIKTNLLLNQVLILCKIFFSSNSKQLRLNDHVENLLVN